MTTSSVTRDNPKGNRKAIKQPTPISQSLRSIMKYGGGTAGQKEGTKKTPGAKSTGKAGSKRMQWEKQQEDDSYGTKAAESNMEEKNNDNNNTGKMSGTEDIEMVDTTGKDDKIENGKWDDKNAPFNSASANARVNVWEEEIVRLEKEAARATTPAYKSLIEKKMQDAQLMLKEALLCMTLDKGKKGKEDEVIDMMDTEDDNASEVRSTVPEEDDEHTVKTVNNKNVSRGKEPGQILMKLPESKTNKNKPFADNTETEDDNASAERVIELEEVEEHTANPTESKRMSPGKGPAYSLTKLPESKMNINKTFVDNTETINWGDISDDETVVLQNQPAFQADTTWELVKNKKQSNNNNTSKALENNKINNPYKKTIKQLGEHESGKQTTESSSKSSLATFLDITKGKMRSNNKHSVRINMSFTPRTSGSGEYTRLARELLAFGNEVDPEILMLPWVENCDMGPINLNDLANPKNLFDGIKRYVGKPSYVNWKPGSPVYGIGINFSTNLEKYEFLNRWNLKKQEYKQNNRAAYSISLAPMQKSPTAFIIGIAVGSTEKQDYELINKTLGKEIGIEGIEASFQNINQFGVTQEFWKLANEKAMSINSDKYSREHLREKFKWAPNALAIYVPQKELVTRARTAMIKRFGKLENGQEPIWPDGSSMRFLPIKGSKIKNDKTRTIVRKRLAYHIWLKANKVAIDTNMVNIHQSCTAFNGLTFEEVVLNSTNKQHQRVFSHFNRVWTNDPSQTKWAISVKYSLYETASQVYNNLKDDLYDKYGPDIEIFFNDKQTTNNWSDAVTSKNDDDEDNWFEEDDDIDDIVKKGVVDSTFLKFFKDKEEEEEEEDKQSVVSWGTGNTAYTEIVTTTETAGTVDSSITQDTTAAADDDTETKKSLVKSRLIQQGVTTDEANDMLDNKTPYEFAMCGSHLPSWDPGKEVFMLLAIRNQYNTNNNK